MSKAQHILCLSYGKDSLACLGAISKLDWFLNNFIEEELQNDYSYN